MGDDSVIECVSENEMVTAYTSITTRGEENYGANRVPVVCLSRCFGNTLQNNLFLNNLSYRIKVLSH